MPNPNQRVGEYVLQDRIAAGTFGQVWRATHHVWVDQVVAVKIPTDPQYLRNLQREGVAIHGLQHPNIVRAIGFDPYADPAYLTMEYVPGTSLRQLITNKSLKVDDAVAVMRQMLAGLSYAHARNLVHRDIKPENVLVHERAFRDGFGTEGVVKVTDFGCGRASTNTAGSIAYSQSIDSPEAREIAGTLDYMAPEQRTGGQVDPRADLYSCGVVLYEMLTGERPAGTDLPSDLNRSVPKYLDEAFRRSYARLDKRFTSADEFIKALGPGVPPVPSAGGGGGGGDARVITFGGGRSVRIDSAAYVNIAWHLASGDKTRAARMLRDAAGVSLTEATQAVESLNNFPMPGVNGPTAGPTPPPVPPATNMRAGGTRTNCTQCRQPVEPGDQFCMSCGVQLVENVRRCPQCGAYPDATDQYCIFCGQVLSSDAMRV